MIHSCWATTLGLALGLMELSLAAGAGVRPGIVIRASDPRFLGSVLDETWDVRPAATKGYIDCIMSLSDVDLNLELTEPGAVSLHFDRRVYAPTQSASAGPIWKIEIDGVALPERITVGPAIDRLSTPGLPAGSHRVRFVQCANPSSPRWAATDPQLSRVTGVTIPAGARLNKSLRSSAWFLPITDSIGEGAVNMNTTTETWRNAKTAYTDSTRAWPARMATLMHKSVAGYLISGIGIVRGGAGAPYGALNPNDPTGRSDPWDHVMEGVPRPFTTAPDFVLLCVGTNEWATDPTTVGHGMPADPSSGDADFARNVETFFARVRRHPQLQTTPIYVSVPFGGYKRAALRQAIDDYRRAHPGESHLELLDLAYGSPGLKTTAGIDEKRLFAGLTKNRPDDLDTVPSPESSDRTHPYGIATAAIGTVDAHQELATVMADRIAALLRGERIHP